MDARRRGSTTAFWNNIAVGSGGVSNEVAVGREITQVAIYVNSSAATTVTIQVAHHGNLDSSGLDPDHDSVVRDYHDLVYTNIPIQLVFASAGKQAVIIPDFEPEWLRLKSSAASTITAGWEATGG
jgi:hypothetical protein